MTEPLNNNYTSTTETIAKRDRTEQHARRFAHHMLSLIQDFIPRRCEGEAFRVLFEAALENGLELTSKAMREQYEAVTLQGLPVNWPQPQYAHGEKAGTGVIGLGVPK